jgi:hypothetical protein
MTTGEPDWLKTYSLGKFTESKEFLAVLLRGKYPAAIIAPVYEAVELQGYGSSVASICSRLFSLLPFNSSSVCED